MIYIKERPKWKLPRRFFCNFELYYKPEFYMRDYTVTTNNITVTANIPAYPHGRPFLDSWYHLENAPIRCSSQPYFEPANNTVILDFWKNHEVSVYTRGFNIVYTDLDFERSWIKEGDPRLFVILFGNNKIHNHPYAIILDLSQGNIHKVAMPMYFTQPTIVQNNQTMFRFAYFTKYEDVKDISQVLEVVPNKPNFCLALKGASIVSIRDIRKTSIPFATLHSNLRVKKDILENRNCLVLIRPVSPIINTEDNFFLRSQIIEGPETEMLTIILSCKNDEIFIPAGTEIARLSLLECFDVENRQSDTKSNNTTTIYEIDLHSRNLPDNALVTTLSYNCNHRLVKCGVANKYDPYEDRELQSRLHRDPHLEKAPTMFGNIRECMSSVIKKIDNLHIDCIYSPGDTALSELSTQT